MQRYRNASGNARHWIDGHRPLVAIILACLVIGGVSVSALTARRSVDTGGGAVSVLHADPTQSDALMDGKREDVAEAHDEKTISVHVVGSVSNPGVYRLKESARVVEAIEAAGGFSQDASMDVINLAQMLCDGDQIRVPSLEEVRQSDRRAEYGIIGADETSSAIRASSSSVSRSSVVDINSADAALLETLPGIGPSTSAKIIAERSANGPFSSLVDLARVSGIGQKKIAALEGLAEAR